jgi:hypothetical protein
VGEIVCGRTEPEAAVGVVSSFIPVVRLKMVRVLAWMREPGTADVGVPAFAVAARAGFQLRAEEFE